jgi:toxin ParE1/3/4
MTRLAINDLEGIYSYISIDSIKYAKVQVLRIRNKTKILIKYPLAGKPVPEYENNSYREPIEGRYRIIYKIVHKNQIDILTIHHSARVLLGRQIE